MSATVALLITRPEGVPIIRVSGDVGAFLEIKPTPEPGEVFFVAVSDGTLLRGAVGEGFETEVAGTVRALVDGTTATFDAAIDWVSVGRTMTDHPESITAEETAEYRAEVAGGIFDDEADDLFNLDGEPAGRLYLVEEESPKG